MTILPLRRQVLVHCDPATAQRLWVDDIGTWWPIASHGCYGEGATVAFEGDTIVETSPAGARAVWGTVTARTPGRLAFTWHPGRTPDEATEVEVTFTAAGADATLVTLVHSGWQSAAARADYAGGWVTVLDRLVDAAVGDGEASGELWFVLEHTAGPATPEAGVFTSPDFALHVAFLRSLAADGVLIAGGPLPDTTGAGMTIVRTPDLATARRTIAAAQLDDGAVRAGLLDVRVRPWRVALSAVN